MEDPAIRNHTRFIVGCITLLGLACVGCGTFLIFKGYQSGELLLSGGAVGAITGLLGFLGGKGMASSSSTSSSNGNSGSGQPVANKNAATGP